MKTPVTALILAALMGGSAFAAVNKDGGQSSVNPCDARDKACAGDAPQAAAEPQGVSEPMVIFLDAQGETLVRLPLSKFRKAQPDAKLPPGIESLR